MTVSTQSAMHRAARHRRELARSWMSCRTFNRRSSSDLRVQDGAAAERRLQHHQEITDVGVRDVHPDADPVGISHAVTVAESGTVSRIRVGVNITHTYIGDLLVVLQSPLGRRAILHAQLGGSDDDLVTTYDSSTPGELATMVGQPMHGDWVLTVIDRAAQDVGVLKSWRLE